MRGDGCWDRSTRDRILQEASSQLWQYIQRNAVMNTAGEVCARLLGLSSNDIDYLTAVHFLHENKIKQFMIKTAPELIRQLSKESHNEMKIFRGMVRGRLDWPATLKTQMQYGGDRSFVAVWERSRTYDLPENRLFKFLLSEIVRLSDMVGASNLVDNELDEIEVIKWADMAGTLRNRAFQMLNTTVIAGIKTARGAADESVMRAERHRLPIYHELAETAVLYRQAFSDNAYYLRTAVESRFLEPLNWDVLFELWVLFKVMNTAEKVGWKIEHKRLIGRNSKSTADYFKNGESLRIYYQRLPADMKSASIYGRLMDKSGLSESFRRPDITIERSNSETTKFCIIEVKRSESRQYLADGAYKLMGYLRDYETCFECSRGRIHGILVGWNGIGLLPRSEIQDQEIILCSSPDISDVLDILLN
ncbi:MAG: hypothetical protein ACM3PP_00105 [Candidatus Saccharibacteria bacterium]